MSNKRRKLSIMDICTGSQHACNFCGKLADSCYGKFFSDCETDTYVHQYCMFFASGLPQNGTDQDGFDGFLVNDIAQEVRRVKRLRCSACRKRGASVGCAVSNCKINCHYPCGLGYGVLHQFFDDFGAYCSRHKPVQDLSGFLETGTHNRCAICFDNMVYPPKTENILKVPCCRDTYMHRVCLQKQALSSGYFFRCPTCNNEDLFVPEMKKFGIYVPERDAAWEDGVAFADLLVEYNRCDMKHCQCPKGRAHTLTSGRWKILRCDSCGQSAVHKECARLGNQSTKQHICDMCLTTENNSRHKHAIKKYSKSCFVFAKDILLVDSSKSRSIVKKISKVPRVEVNHTPDLGLESISNLATKACHKQAIVPCTSSIKSSRMSPLQSQFSDCASENGSSYSSKADCVRVRPTLSIINSDQATSDSDQEKAPVAYSNSHAAKHGKLGSSIPVKKFRRFSPSLDRDKDVGRSRNSSNSLSVDECQSLLADIKTMKQQRKEKLTNLFDSNCAISESRNRTIGFCSTQNTTQTPPSELIELKCELYSYLKMKILLTSSGKE